jgi:N-acetylmuramoyl-L-alanine amidase
VGQSGRSRRRRWPLGWRLLLAAGLAALPVPAFAGGPLAGETIVVDPGHGGLDGGASSGGRVEKAVTLRIGLDLSSLLRGAGARVVLTRSSDRFVSLATRVAIADGAGGDAFISIHANALGDPGYSGLTTFYGASSGFVTGVRRTSGLVAASHALATDVQAATQARTGEVDRGVQSADYYVLGNSHMPTVLVETGFITNPAEGQRLTSPAYDEALAAGIARGVTRFAADPNQSTPNLSGPAGPEPPAPGPESYVVRPGDTLSAIALRLGATQAALRAANALSNRNLIYAGQTLLITGGASTSDAAPVATYMAPLRNGAAAGRSYVVQPGDTLTAIARRVGASVATLARANEIEDTDHLLAGQTLQLPGGRLPGVGQAGAGAAPTPVASPGNERYHIRSGDTLSAIAARLGVSERALATANQLSDPDHLIAGRYLAIPASD